MKAYFLIKGTLKYLKLKYETWVVFLQWSVICYNDSSRASRTHKPSSFKPAPGEVQTQRSAGSLFYHRTGNSSMMGLKITSDGMFWLIYSVPQWWEVTRFWDNLKSVGQNPRYDHVSISLILLLLLYGPKKGWKRKQTSISRSWAAIWNKKQVGLIITFHL